MFKPHLSEDGEYELIVTGKDRSNNASGAIEYRVMFEVYNKSMITNWLNYPNPFTTSTAFVFTLTGSELPSNFRIQILTITGKIVKEISRQELGPIRIGHNITEYKWDGKDQFGQDLANGVYLYRVMADIQGKKIDKLNSSSYNTDKYFQSGYGKMYLMR
jgi:flagellar hook assembly protein FlgD